MNKEYYVIKLQRDNQEFYIAHEFGTIRFKKEFNPNEVIFFKTLKEARSLENEYYANFKKNFESLLQPFVFSKHEFVVCKINIVDHYEDEITTWGLDEDTTLE